jgi:predicted nuclease of restriction endonuclease-like (RecB) superfamily
MLAENNNFFEKVAQIIEQARVHIGRTVDLTMCVTYFEVGRMIVEEEQEGKARAEYGRGLLKGLSGYLTEKFGKGFSETNLRNARKFYQIYLPSIQQLPTAESNIEKGQSLTDIFKVTWTHYLVLMRIKNEQERRFYEIEAARQQWSVDNLRRQYNSSLYERLALSRNKDEVMQLAKDGQKIEKPQDILKNPLVLEFLDMAEDSSYSESDLETAIISKLQQFLLELGRGFLFEARQKRFTFEEEHFMVDLVFYNRLLQCYVVIDLKTDKLKHQDLGQMQMYVNYFDRYVKAEHENPTIGILLCKEKKDSIVQLTLPENANIYASAYSLYLPDKSLLQQKLSEWIEEFEEAQEALKIANMDDHNEF